MNNICIEEFENYNQFRFNFDDNNDLYSIRHEIQKLHFHHNNYIAICSCCGKLRRMTINISVGVEPNYREELICNVCNLNNRVRAVYQYLIEDLNINDGAAREIYLTEQRTPLYNAITKCDLNANVTASEYFGDKLEKGEIGDHGIRNEDLTELTFKDDSFDAIVCLEVLEHVPNYLAALKELYRVSANGGSVIITVPFLWDTYKTLVRSKIDNGKLVNILEPEYHGDPNSDNPCLCFYHYGWDFLDKLRDVGFKSVKAILYWSAEYGYLGNYQIMIIAKKV